MRLNADIDTRFLQARVLKEQKRLAYNVVQALNEAAKDIQAQVRADMAKDFHLRDTSKKNKKWLLERLKIKFASVKQGRVVAEIYVDQKPRLLLGKFEKGGTREPFVGKHVAVPNPEGAREGGSVEGGIKQSLTFKELQLKKVPNKQGRELLDIGFKSGLNRKQYRNLRNTLTPNQYQIKGQHRTFLLRSTKKAPLGGVFQRTGPGKDDIRLIYSFKRAFQLKRLMHLVETAKKAFPGKFRLELLIAFAKGKDGIPGA